MCLYTFVDQKTCIACGAAAPKIFNYDDEGLSYVVLNDNLGKKNVPRRFENDLYDTYEGCRRNLLK